MHATDRCTTRGVAAEQQCSAIARLQWAVAICPPKGNRYNSGVADKTRWFPGSCRVFFEDWEYSCVMYCGGRQQVLPDLGKGLVKRWLSLSLLMPQWGRRPPWRSRLPHRRRRPPQHRPLHPLRLQPPLQLRHRPPRQLRRPLQRRLRLRRPLQLQRRHRHRHRLPHQRRPVRIPALARSTIWPSSATTR